MRQAMSTRVKDDLHPNTRQNYVVNICAHNQKAAQLPEDSWCVQALSCCCACVCYHSRCNRGGTMRISFRKIPVPAAIALARLL